MTRKKPILALDIGSSQLAMAEFSVLKPAGLELVNYAVAPLGLESGSGSDSDPSAYIVSTIRDMMRENNIAPGPVLISIAGKDIFPRYVKLPPGSREKIEQIVQYEAVQNVPYAIEEVVWDYQLMDNEEGGQSVMLVAVKSDIVKRFTDCVEAAGLDPEIVDVAPMALYNLTRFNYGDAEGCIMVMDMGARTTNLIFIERKRAFSRSIPVAGNTITQELMKEFDVSYKDAEELKIAHAFVAFGGVVEGSEDLVVNRVSKTVRSVMTRLHAEVSRSISFYRSQQSGTKPSFALLAGGSSVIRETDTFFREKLGIPVEYLNVLENITVADSIPAEKIASQVHLLGEVTGLALRRVFSCPMEINLMPRDLVARRTLAARVPFFMAAAVGLLLIVACWGAYIGRLRMIVRQSLEVVSQQQQRLDGTKKELDVLVAAKTEVQHKADRLLSLVKERTRWVEIIEAFHSRMLEGLWLKTIQTRHGPDGRIMLIEITGVGFVDKVNTVDAVSQFLKSLMTVEYFAGGKVERIQTKSASTMEFVIQMFPKDSYAF